MYHFVQANARKAYARITQSRITTAFFVFSLFYCCAQIILQSLLFSVDYKYAIFLSDIVKAGDLPPANFTFLQGSKGHMHLRMCDDIPFSPVQSPCTTIYDSAWNLTRAQTLSAPRVLDGWEKDSNVTRLLTPFNATRVVAVQVKTRDSIVNLSEQCVQIILYPSQLLQNFTAENITCFSLQIWLLGISCVAILYGSVPHTLAALVMRILATGWAVYTTWRGPAFAAIFQELIAGPTSPCFLDLFSTYWKIREVYEVTDFILSSTGLLVFLCLSWPLLKAYNAESVKCVGAPLHVVRIQKFFMALLSILYLEVFVLITSLGLWHKNLSGTAVDHMTAHTPIYQAVHLTTLILLLPWIVMGWYAIRREKKRMMVAFLGIGFVITVDWSILFTSDVYRWGFVQWPYLACYTVVSFILLIASLVLGIICRMNFGKGLAHYLHAEAILASLNFAPGIFSHDTNITIVPTSTGTHEHRLKELDKKIEELENRVFVITSFDSDTLEMRGSLQLED